ncbi:MAG: AEC family transporter [Candidatus Didemnitutus sp.]|nr:AEC family transporter [Candidatus Didemnitutus sp.]
MLVLNALAPVFLMIALGAWMQRTEFVSASFLREANRVTYWLGLPALLFSQLVNSLHQAAGAEKLLGAMGVVLALSLVAGYALAVLLRVPGGAMGTFVQGAFRGNLAFVGLPIVFALPNVPVLGGMPLHSAAVLVVAPTMVIYNLGAVVVLVASQHAFGWASVRPVVRQLAVTPPLLATLAGMGFAAMGWTLPHAIAQTLEALGEMALPLGLLGVGGSLVTARLGSAWKAPVGSAVLKTFGGPLLAWAAARMFGLGAVETSLLMILSAAPTAIVSYTMAVELKGDEQLASATIVVSVATSLAALAACVALFPQ